MTQGLNATYNPHLLIGNELIFSILDDSLEILEKSLKNLLDASYTSGVPISIKFDNVNWWHKSNLWNWWNKSESGYDPTNINNVERISPWLDSAVKIGWRNWGS